MRLKCFSALLFLFFAGTLSALDFAAPPWLSHPEPGKISIQFLADAPCAAMLEYRFAGEKEWRHLSNTLAGKFVRDRALHRFRLCGKPGAACTFRAVLIDPQDRAKEIRSAETAVRLPEKDRKNYAFAFMSDFQFTTQRCQELIGKYGRLTGMKDCDFAVSGGDMSMGFDSVKDDILNKWILPVRNAFPILPMVPVRGNHEWRGGITEDWTRMMCSPETRMPYYAFAYGPDFFIVLDTFEDKPDHRGKAVYTYFHESAEYRKAERAWLAKVVQSAAFRRARYRIVLGHCAPYCNENGFNTTDVRKLIGGLLDKDTPQERITLWMGGHDHSFMRGMPGDEKICMYKPSAKKLKQSITGGRDFPFPVILQDGPGGECSSSASRVSVSDRGIEVKTMIEDGTVIDHVLLKPDGKAEVFAAPARYEVRDFTKRPEIYQPYKMEERK